MVNLKFDDVMPYSTTLHSFYTGVYIENQNWGEQKVGNMLIYNVLCDTKPFHQRWILALPFSWTFVFDFKLVWILKSFDSVLCQLKTKFRNSDILSLCVVRHWNLHLKNKKGSFRQFNSVAFFLIKSFNYTTGFCKMDKTVIIVLLLILFVLLRSYTLYRNCKLKQIINDFKINVDCS